MIEKEPIDWNKFKMRCSSLHALFVEPQTKAAKEAGELSETAKKHLQEVYIEEKWGRRDDILTVQMEKGVICQDEIMAILSFMEDTTYERNKKRETNEWITGEADIVHELITDIKASWKPKSFIPNLTGPIPAVYHYQGQGYCWLWDKPGARTVWGLANCPEPILKKLRSKLLFHMDVATDLSPEYLEAVKELEREHTFDDIPLSERLIIKKVDRDEEIISQIPTKVIKARSYLKFLDETHQDMGKLVAGVAIEARSPTPTIKAEDIQLIKIKK